MLRGMLLGLGGLLLGGPEIAVAGIVLLPVLCGVVDVIRHEPSTAAGQTWGQGESSRKALLLAQRS
jgi:hypothetical protein